jgi:hypothetical protein
MASLSGQNPSATFPSLIKTINNNPVTSLVQLSDGNGNGLPISVSTTNVSISTPLTASIVAATNNGNGTNFKIGDDIFLGDVNISNTFQVKGVGDGTQGFIKFGSGSNSAIIGGVAGASIFQISGSLNVSSSITSTVSGLNSTLTNSNGMVITGGTSQLRLINNTGIWADDVQSSYLQFSGSYGRYVSVLGGAAGTDSTIQRLQFSSQYTQFVTSSIDTTPVPTHLVEVLGGDLYVSNNTTASIVWATNNGNGTNFQIGDDVWLGDVNIANTLQIKGQQDGTKGFIKFGSGSNSPIVGGIAGSNVFQVTGSVAVSSVLSLAPQNPLPAASTAPYSFAVSASTPAKPYFSDGTSWNALY